jgi:tRNA threonylcarbamoyladenosine biosynthesis protein TsaE
MRQINRRKPNKHGDPTSANPTTLVKGIAQALDAADPDEVTSPTFTLVHEYDGHHRVDGKEHDAKPYHIDALSH